MNDENRKQLLEQREEIEMMLLMDAYMESEGVQILEEFEEAKMRGDVSDIPEALDEKCRHIIHSSFAKQEQKHFLTRISKYIGKVAVYILLFLGAVGTLVLSVDALRIPALNFFLERSARSSYLALEDMEYFHETEASRIKSCISELIPDNYQLSTEIVEEYGYTLLCYQDLEDHTILIKAIPSDGRLSVDSENANPSDIEINGYAGLFIEKDGYNVYWFNSEKNLTYNVYSDYLSINTFWDIVYSLAS